MLIRTFSVMKYLNLLRIKISIAANVKRFFWFDALFVVRNTTKKLPFADTKRQKYPMPNLLLFFLDRT